MSIKKSICYTLVFTLLFASMVFTVLVSPARAAIEDFGAPGTVTVSSIQDLVTAVSNAQPGDTIILANSTYNNGVFTLNGNGDASQYITIKPQTPGGVIFTGATTITLNGSYLEFRDFKFNECDREVIKLQGASYCRVYGNYFYQCGGKDRNYGSITMEMASHHNLVEHNTFEKSKQMGVRVRVGQTNNDTQNTYNQINYNYFKDTPHVKDIYGQTNGMESIQIGQGTAKDLVLNYLHANYTTVKGNLFVNVTGEGSEIISNKCSNNTYVENTFLDCNSGLTIRSGNNCTVDSNILINTVKGIRAYGSGHKITNNYVYGATYRGITLGAGNYALYNPPTSTSTFKPFDNGLVANNTLVNNAIGINMLLTYNATYNVYPNNSKIINNLIINDYGKCFDIGDSIGMTYSNNIVQTTGTAVIGLTDPGVTIGYPAMAMAGDGLFRPTNTSVVQDAGVSIDEVGYGPFDYNHLIYDMDGQVRTRNPDIGADEILSSNKTRKIVTVNDVTAGTAYPQVTAPAAPALQSAVPGVGEVNISWSPVEGTESYKVYAGKTCGFYTPVATVTNSVCSYNVRNWVVNTLPLLPPDTILKTETPYYFVVKAINPGGYSANSNEIRAVSLPSTPPVITINGVSNGTDYTDSVTPIIEIKDNESGVQNQSIMLNGNTYVSGTAITTPGNHILTVTTKDYAGNTASEDINFKLYASTHLSVSAAVYQYSDPMVLSAELISKGMPLAEKKVSFKINGIEAGITVTNAEGRAIISTVAGLAAGSYTVTASYVQEDTAYLRASNAAADMKVTLEGASIAYIGQTIEQYPGTFNIAAKLSQENDGYIGDLAKTKVLFDVSLLMSDGSIVPAGSYTSDCSASGDASVAKALGVGVYKVTSTIVDNGYFSAASDSVTLAVFDADAGFITGGGWYAERVGKANFGFNAKYHGNQSEGNIEFQYKEGGIDFKSSQVSWMVISSYGAQFQGTGTMEGESGVYTFRVDFTAGADKKEDVISIRIWAGSDTYAEPIYKVVNKQPGGGNITLH